MEYSINKFVSCDKLGLSEIEMKQIQLDEIGNLYFTALCMINYENLNFE